MAQIHQATPHLEVLRLDNLHLGNLHLAVRNNFTVNI